MIVSSILFDIIICWLRPNSNEYHAPPWILVISNSGNLRLTNYNFRQSVMTNIRNILIYYNWYNYLFITFFLTNKTTFFQYR